MYYFVKTKIFQKTLDKLKIMCYTIFNTNKGSKNNENTSQYSTMY